MTDFDFFTAAAKLRHAATSYQAGNTGSERVWADRNLFECAVAFAKAYAKLKRSTK